MSLNNGMLPYGCTLCGGVGDTISIGSIKHRESCPSLNEPQHPADRAISAMKETNPKDAVGIKKAPLSTVPSGVLMELGVAMLEGARKYGRHNFRISGVRASVYYDAAMRHLMAWWEGEDTDPDSGISHVTKAIATLVVLRDAMGNHKLTDDRPPAMPENWMVRLNEKAAAVIEKYPDPKPAHTNAETGGAK